MFAWIFKPDRGQINQQAGVTKQGHILLAIHSMQIMEAINFFQRTLYLGGVHGTAMNLLHPLTGVWSFSFNNGQFTPTKILRVGPFVLTCTECLSVCTSEFCRCWRSHMTQNSHDVIEEEQKHCEFFKIFKSTLKHVNEMALWGKDGVHNCSMYNGSKLEKIYKKAWVVLNHSSYNLKVIKQYMKAAQYMGQKWRERKKGRKNKTG